MAAKNTRVAMMAAGAALGMLGLGFASVPLYRIFCQTTGFGGTTMKITEAQAATIQSTDKVVIIRFDANVERGMPWQFRPTQNRDTVSIGARDMTVFVAKNVSDKAMTGTASFNVEPELAGKYFSKVQCFCFTEQTLRPGEEVRMPVIYYVDPRILQDPETRDVDSITLSYTFHPTPDAAAEADAVAKPARTVGAGG